VTLYTYILCLKGHSIRHVTKGGAADQASLRAGDRLIAVGKTNVEKEKHAQVVYLIKQAGREVTLLVIDEEGYKELKAKKVPITENLAKSGSVKPKQSTIEPSASKTKQSEMKPRLCHVVRRDGGFGFFLKDDKGHYLINLEKNGPAFRAGALNNDRIVEVNGVNVENEPHSVVVKMIHPSNEVTFLVVGKLEDKYFRDNGIAITSDLLNTPDENQKHMPTDQEESQSQSRTVEFQETTTEGKPTCVICLTNAVNVYFRPCGHVCCCRDCHGQLTTCPMCRKPIVEKLFAFL
ncbi:Na(+)/H(+) exchange regulatory cofactor NHE-RF3-like, partial [Styela clava]